MRAALLPVFAVLGLVETGVLISAVGPASFGAVLLIGTLFQLLPFADLGVGGAVTRAVAASRSPATDEHVAKVIRRSRRVLLASAVVVAVVSALLGLAGAWGPILGLDGQVAHPDLTATATLVLFAAALPLGLGQRMLLGAGKNHVAVAATVVQPASALMLALGLYAVSAPADAYVLLFPVANLISVCLMSVLAWRLVGIRTSLRGPSDVRVLPIALPMFLISVGFPISLQSDKIVISHQLNPQALAEYALATQLYAPGFTVLSTAAMALLPIFVHRRAHGLAFRSLWLRVATGFAAVAAVGGLVYVVATPLVAGIVSDEKIRLSPGLRWAFGALLIVQISGFVTSTLLNRPEEMSRQATAVLNMSVANVGLSWVLAERVGVAGPVVASAITLGLLLVLPQVVAGWRLRDGEQVQEPD